MDGNNHRRTAPMYECSEHRKVLGRRLAEFERTQKTSPSKNVLWVGWRKWATSAVVLVIALAVVAVPFPFMRAGDNTGGLKYETQQKTGAQSQLSPTGPPVKCAGLDMIYRRNGQRTKPEPSIPSISKEEAEKQTGIKVVLPDCEEITGELLGIYVGSSASGNPEVCLQFGKGILLTEEAWKDKPDFSAMVEADKRAIAESSVYIGGYPSVVSVERHTAEFKTEYTFQDVDKQLCGLPAQLYWWDNGVKYFLTAWKLGFTQDQLIQIAESMYK